MNEYPEHPRAAVGAIVQKDSKILLIKRGQYPDKGLWAIPGGRVKLGETLEQAAEREILEETDGVTETAIITAYHHHERLDGSGYPHGLKADKISYSGQALAIVDVYDSLTTKKCYRRKIPPTQALEMIYEWSERQFNRELVQKFIRCIGIYPVGSLVRLESGLIGVVIDHCEDNLLQPVVRAIYNRKTDRYIPVPYDIDLSQPQGSGGRERILSYEFQEELNIQPEMYL